MERSPTLLETEATQIARPRLAGAPKVASDVSDEAVAFVQERLANFGMVFAIFSGLFFIVRTTVLLILGRWGDLQVTYTCHFLGFCVSAFVWLWCRTGQRSLRVLRALEVLAMLAPAVFYAAMMIDLPMIYGPETVVVLALTFGCFGRAVYIPSSGFRTFVLTALSGLPVIVGTFAIWTFRYEEVRASHELVFQAAGSEHVAGINTAFTITWWTLTTGISTLASRVIYGLRAEVRSVRKLGQYALESKIGEGGMGVVYVASHAMLRRPTAIKLLPPDRAGEQNIARFEREVQLTARLTHPNTVTVFDYGRTPDGVFYYAMELLDGATLAEIVQLDGPQPEARVLHVVAAVASALSEAHGVGLIHRDIKPSNIMLCRRGGLDDVPKVLDFGLVKDIFARSDAVLTQTNALTGTPQYISPEALSAPEEVDARSDIYALGAVTYFLCTGTHVFNGGTLVEVCAHHLHSEPEPPSLRRGRRLDPALESLILSCLKKRREDRPQSALEFLERLEECQQFGAWKSSDARAWWSSRGAALSERRSTSPRSSGDRTIAADLARPVPGRRSA